jgi:hypothetical protein|eukprot:CAMPEP_0169308582 /NCGR_PEP_ID=MMETSP1017-20121227/1933_1 /TAXON_ID=342587 /ORGANISM="Karlodinium micrum, Strain CCMP2283" /LENGTH=78 /DNA_ID=CAMNT_0009402007 /DNA_START=1426 /DNA_END=1662 /DNA_ORIENTATION=+
MLLLVELPRGLLDLLPDGDVVLPTDGGLFWAERSCFLFGEFCRAFPADTIELEDGATSLDVSRAASLSRSSPRLFCKA